MRLPFTKNKKTPYPHSFAKRLTWRIMLRMLIIMGFASFVLFWTGYLIVFGGASAISELILKGQYEEVRRITSDVYVASINTVPAIEENLDKPDRLFDIMERMIKTNERIRSCGVSFVADYYPQKGRCFCPYAVRIDSATVKTKMVGSKENDYLNADWFKEAIKAEKGYWSKSFKEGFGEKEPLVSYLVPIHDKSGRSVAVLGVDLSLRWLSEKVQFDSYVSNDSTEEWSAKREFYYFMVDSIGTFLIHPDQKRIVSDNFLNYVNKDPDKVSRKIMERKQGESNNFVLEDEDVFIFYRPVKYTDWTITMVVPMLYVNAIAYTIGGLFILLVSIGLLVVYFSGRRTIKRAFRPVKMLAISADEVAKGNFNTQLPRLKSHDEIHQLRDSFEQMQHSLTNYMEELKATTAQKASIESELNIAHTIQMSMLPKTFPPYPERHDIDIYGQLTPAKAVGGDLFDFFIHDEKLFFCVGDVSGKGVPASLFMAVTRSLFRNISTHQAEPHRIVMALNDSLVDGNETSMFVTLFVGVLDLKSGRLLYCNAGHNAPLLIGQRVCKLPCNANLPLGVIAGWQFTLQETVIAPQTTIFLYTDGLNEAENTIHSQFGDDRIIGCAKSMLAQNEHQPVALIRNMTEAVRTFVGNAEQSDDLTMLAVQYIG